MFLLFASSRNLLKFSSVPLAAGLVAKTLNNSRDVTNSATQNETFFAVEFTMTPPNISSSHHLHAVGTLFRLATRSLKRISGGLFCGELIHRAYCLACSLVERPVYELSGKSFRGAGP
jgi:hypothetical protein